MNRPLIFLDVDGVLNTHDFNDKAKSNVIHRDKVEIINAVVQCTGCRIVLSSAWRYLVIRGEMNLTGLNWLFRSHGLIADAIIDVTGEDFPRPYGDPFQNERSYEIEKYLVNKNHTGKYLIIDDNDFGFTENGMPFIQTNTETGITVADGWMAIQMLKDEAQ